MTKLALVALGWLCLSAARLNGCSHPLPTSIVTEAPAQASPLRIRVFKSLTHQATRQVPAADPLGPCRGAHCDSRPGHGDEPSSSTSTTDSRPSWDLAIETVAGACDHDFTWSPGLDACTPRSLDSTIFHPPRRRG